MASGSVAGGNEDDREKPNLKESKVYTRKSFKGLKTDEIQPQVETLAFDKADLSQKQLDPGFASAPDDSSTPKRTQAGNLGFISQENRVTINLAVKSKKEIREYRRKLQSELHLVRSWVRKIEGKESEKTGVGFGKSGGLKKKRMHSEVERTGPLQSRPLNQLSVSVLENSHGASENVEKEKRTPKVNQFYQNADFLLAKDKFPAADKKSKGGGKNQGGEMGWVFTNQLVKSCSGLLERLMKHKHGWVFNKPVDVKALGLHDYFDIIKHPMDLGTVKSKLSKNLYNTPREFAEDVRLVFHNAMTYNPKGQDVYHMAEQLLQIFEDKWDVIEADYLQELKRVVDNEGSLPTPSSRKAHKLRQPPQEMKSTLERSESISHSVDLNTKLTNLGRPGRPAAPKKPKAKDPNKREMTYDEKQKLSSNLQSLPADKLETVVDIIKKRNPSLCEHDDEIEVDIESFDTEMLWELDRFVINYKKNLSKHKKNAELANKSKPVVEDSAHIEHGAPVLNLAEEAPEGNKAGKEAITTTSPIRLEKQVKNTSQASKSSSSGTGSDSSSSDSDSGTSG